ncbi:MAG TPA: hypothetical protein GXX49_02940 [Clostridiaceae bacterium]|nr:hypothetical protein [Clostridiaceae bacterium]
MDKTRHQDQEQQWEQEDQQFGETESREETDKFACPGCGANMTFNPDTQTLYCQYCGKSIDIKANGDIDEHDFYTANDNAKDWGKENRVIKCESCGAQTLLETYSTAQFCAFCGSSHVVKVDESAGIPPQSLIPFKVSLNKATELFKKWIKRRFFAPKAVKTDSQIKKISGVYIPCWTYDSNTFSNYVAEKGTYYYVTRTHWVTRNGKRERVVTRERRIRWRWVSGTYSRFFDDVLVNASKNADSKLMKKLEPFNMKELVPYDSKFLTGFLAERYSIGLDPGWEIAKQEIKAQIRQGVINQINGDEVRNLKIDTRYSNITYKHILLPVWMASYKYKDKIYRFMVNGQTGEVQGYSPVSPWKVVAVVVAVLALLCIGLYLYSNSAPIY